MTSRSDSYYQQQRQIEFTKKCKSLFPIGRKFANYRQLDEYVTQFLQSWKIVKSRDGYSFRCFYAETKRKSESKTFSKTKITNRTRLKDSTACPFVIRFSIPGVKNKSLPTILKEVKLTEVVTSHNCGLCNESFRTASRMSKS